MMQHLPYDEPCCLQVNKNIDRSLWIVLKCPMAGPGFFLESS
jgi:hypothetical protein